MNKSSSASELSKSLSQGSWDHMSDYEKSQLAGDNNDWVDETRLQPQPHLELADHEKEQRKSVGAWDKVSAEEGGPKIYQIPVDVAIDLVAENGLPQFPVVEAKE